MAPPLGNSPRALQRFAKEAEIIHMEARTGRNNSEIIEMAESVTACSLDEVAVTQGSFLMTDGAWVAGAVVVVTTIIAVTIFGGGALPLIFFLYYVKRFTNPLRLLAVSGSRIFLLSVDPLRQKPNAVVSQFPMSAIRAPRKDRPQIVVHGRTYEADSDNWRRLLRAMAIVKKNSYRPA